MRYLFASLAAILLLGMFIDYAISEKAKNNPQPLAVASSTLAVVPAPVPLTLPDLTIASDTPAAPIATSTPKSPKPVNTPAPKPKPAPPTPTPLPEPVPTPEPTVTAPAPTIPSAANDLALAAVSARAALVNILCIAPYGSGIPSISGSGTLIDPKGIILTNAHVAESFLLVDKGVRCTIRGGSPARNEYTASLIYISPEWLKANPKTLVQSAPSGTGEHDIALLGITGSTDASPLPASFPTIPLAVAEPVLNQPVVISTYAAQFLTSDQISQALNPTIVYGSIHDIFTFVASTVDIVSLGGSAAAQEGSSGGGVIDAASKETAMVVTSTVTGDTSTRNLSAITATYIAREYATATGIALSATLAAPVANSIAAFAPQIPALEALVQLR